MREAEPHSYQDYLKYFTEHTPRNINYLKIKKPHTTSSGQRALESEPY